MRLPTLVVALALAALACAAPGLASRRLHLPYAEAGLTERQAAAHLLDRLTYGPRPGEVDRVVQMGLETWLARQLDGGLASPGLDQALAPLDALAMTPEQIERTFPNPAFVLREAEQAGVLKREERESNRQEFQRKVRAYYQQKGYRPLRELNAQLVAQKLLRSVYSENQLHEVLTDFWFNHFNVSLTDNQCRMFVLPYERDALRPHVLGRFRTMLGATARHPAMLLYLDNATSSAAASSETTMDRALDGMGSQGRRVQQQQKRVQQQLPAQARRKRGINENYARELMELHTLGVDGGYTQQDVVEVARAFTGWTVVPVRPQARQQVEKRLQQGQKVGFVRDGEFLFRADQHDAGAKTILGTRFPAGGGLQEGERVLDMLAVHPSTARHVATKLATRFVSDTPPPALVDRLSRKWLATKGDLRAVMEELVQSPEFWRSRGAKIKAPHELAASAMRALGAKVKPSRDLYDWISRMGEPLYSYQAPTGFPDRGDFWINTGSLLNRMNFGLSLAAGRVDGVRVDLKALNGNREPASPAEALEVYARLLLPERDVQPLVQQLLPAAQDPAYAERVAAAAPEPAAEEAMGEPGPRRRQATGPVSPLAQVVGVLLGSPEFQRN